MDKENVVDQFFVLVRAGLWEKECFFSQHNNIDFGLIYKVAQEQSVVGLIAAGLEHVKDINVPQEWALQYIGSTLQIEQRNKAMNIFISELIESLRREGVYSLLVKGQGVAQCYERPLWRASGDVDLLLSKSNYVLAKKYLLEIADSIEKYCCPIKIGID